MVPGPEPQWGTMNSSYERGRWTHFKTSVSAIKMLDIAAVPHKVIKTKTCRPPHSARNDRIGFYDCHGRWRQLGVKGKLWASLARPRFFKLILLFDLFFFDLIFLNAKPGLKFHVSLGSLATVHWSWNHPNPGALGHIKAPQDGNAASEWATSSAWILI